MMDNTPAKKCRKSPENRHTRPPFSLFFLRKCLTNCGCYILLQGTEENSYAICRIIVLNINMSIAQLGISSIYVPKQA